MNSTRRRWLVGLLVSSLSLPFLVTAHAAARTEHRKAPSTERAARVREHLRRIADQLELTDTQRQQLREILVAARDEAQAVRNDPTLNRRQKRAALLAIRRDVREAAKEILTAQQWEQWQALREDEIERLRLELGRQRTAPSNPPAHGR